MQQIFSIDQALHPFFKKAFLDAGFEMSQPAFTSFMARKEGHTFTLYISGKLVIQGKAPLELIPPDLLPHLPGSGGALPKPLNEELPLIGTDESGKGDFFGPLVVAGVAATLDHLKILESLKVRDSKLLTDKAALDLAHHLKEILPYAVIAIHPIKYNELYEKTPNLNHLLANVHAQVINKLRKQTHIERILVDQFATQDLISPLLDAAPAFKLMQRPGAESHPVVAAASILARAAFLEELEKLSKKVDFTLPKGASKKVLDAGGQILTKYGEEMLGKVSKLHFKTHADILQNYGRESF